MAPSGCAGDSLGLVIFHPVVQENFIRHDILPQFTQFLISTPHGRVELKSLEEILFGLDTTLRLFGDDSEEVEPVAAVGDKF